MARAAGQERSPRPPSGRGAHGSGADLSQLASAARLSSIHLCGLPQQPLQEPEQSPPGLPESPGAAAGRLRDGPPIRALCADQRAGCSLPRAPRAKDGGGGLLSKNPRPGRSSLCGAWDGARTDVCSGAPSRSGPAGPASARRRGRGRRSGGVGVGLFTRSFRGAVKGARFGGLSGGKRRGVVPGSAQVRLSRSARWASGGAASRALRSWQVNFSGQVSLPVLRPSCSSAEVPANAKFGNCFSGTFTAAVPYPGQGAVAAAITLQTTACLTEQSHSSSAQFQLLASTSTSTPGHASRDIMCQSHGLPENLEQEFPNSRFLFRYMCTNLEMLPRTLV